MSSDLHRLVRSTYTRAMRRHAGNADAFDEAVSVLRRELPSLPHVRIRRMAALMLAQEPDITDDVPLEEMLLSEVP
ncbi:MAG TPA: hypothetical protein VGD08_23995 [Stellaceae bacterium]